MSNNITIRCSCGKYEACFDFEGIAESAARMHVMLGPEHVVTVYRRVYRELKPQDREIFVVRHEEGK